VLRWYYRILPRALARLRAGATADLEAVAERLRVARYSHVGQPGGARPNLPWAGRALEVLLTSL